MFYRCSLTLCMSWNKGSIICEWWLDQTLLMFSEPWTLYCILNELFIIKSAAVILHNLWLMLTVQIHVSSLTLNACWLLNQFFTYSCLLFFPLKVMKLFLTFMLDVNELLFGLLQELYFLTWCNLSIYLLLRWAILLVMLAENFTLNI